MFGEPKACVKQAVAYAYGDGEPVWGDLFAEYAAAGGREFVVNFGDFAALGKKFYAGGERAEEVF